MTSIEWLINWGKENPVAFQSDYYEAIEKAKEMHNKEMVSISNQQEISDEEIEKAVNEYAESYKCPSELTMCKHDIISAWNNAIKWYREQLKQKQNK